MNPVEEIEAAINNLTAEEFGRFTKWFRERDEMVWDQQLDSDASTGKLDFLFHEAENEGKKGSLSDWPALP